jgi:glutamine amidotransferase
MCRHVAYVGPPVDAAALLLDPPHALVTQVDSPRCQLPGVTNRDGWGLAWRDAGGGWSVHRSTAPLSEDPTADAAIRGVTSTAVVAAVRRASPGLALVASGNAPFVAGQWAFSLNGFVGGFAEGVSRPALVAALSAPRAGSLAGDTDTEVLLGLVLDHLDAGTEPGAALAAVVGLALDAAGDRDSRLNLLLSDGAATWATRWSNSLFHRTAAGSVVVASEPWDDRDDWTEVPDRSVVHATPAAAVVSPLA